ncbi:MAG: NUDIX hydrolase [Candidatus Pacebacteria bacterium]|nr:NUDIX hydrolase [Candidatus Paceibacterota bacterium]
MINGSFTIISWDGRALFLKRKDTGLWDLTGGGFDVNEIDYKAVSIREIREETGIIVDKDSLHLVAVLGQRLPKRIQEIYPVENGLVFLHSLFLRNNPVINISDEHSDFKFFSYSEILDNWKDFSSGPLWLYFTFLKFQESCKLQEGLLRDRSIWQGKKYLHWQD